MCKFLFSRLGKESRDMGGCLKLASLNLTAKIQNNFDIKESIFPEDIAVHSRAIGRPIRILQKFRKSSKQVATFSIAVRERSLCL